MNHLKKITELENAIQAARDDAHRVHEQNRRVFEDLRAEHDDVIRRSRTGKESPAALVEALRDIETKEHAHRQVAEAGRVGAEARVQAAQREHAAYVAQHVDAIVGDLTPDLEAAQADLEKADLAQMRAAERVRGIQAQVDGWLKTAGIAKPQPLLYGPVR